MILSKEKMLDQTIAKQITLWFDNCKDLDGIVAKVICLEDLNNMRMRMTILAHMFKRDPNFPSEEIFEYFRMKAKEEKENPNGRDRS